MDLLFAHPGHHNHDADAVPAGPETALAGNGGSANASANGGAGALGDINSGSNMGSAIGVGDSVGSVAVDGGVIANTTNLGVSLNGGTAVADASGGDSNVAFVS
ncbi:MAG: hypothetical protein ACKOWF_16900 [Chloroflexota bacterium]